MRKALLEVLIGKEPYLADDNFFGYDCPPVILISEDYKMKKKYLKWALVIVWAIIIFLFSNQTGDISNNNNKFVVDLFKMVGVNLDSYFGGMIDFIIRKLAHFLEYFILYYLVYNALVEDISRKSALITSLIIVFIYACSDEIHQAFIPGRSPRIRDVLIDTGGGLLCMVLNILWKK